MAHSQKSIRDHARNRTHPNVDNEAISRQLEQLLKPCVYNQLAYYRSLGMRERILGLPKDACSSINSCLEASTLS